MAFAQGKQGHTYNITDQEMEEARDVFGQDEGGHFEISDVMEDHLPFCGISSRFYQFVGAKTLIFHTLLVCQESEGLRNRVLSRSVMYLVLPDV